MDPHSRQILRWPYKARFTLGVRANVQPKSSIPIGAKVEISPKVMALYWPPPRLKTKDTIKSGRPICNPGGPIF
jgi:hypothetical protein